jgi:RNA polymerase sigma-70 factor (ECF subfamily)
MEQALKRLRAEQEAAGTLAQFELLSSFLFDDSHSADYAQTSERLGLARNAVAAAVSRLRKRYRQLIRSEIAQTVSQPSEIEDELQHLFAVTSD